MQETEIRDILNFDFESYLLEFNQKISFLSLENERLKKIIDQKNDVIHQLEDCILTTSENPSETPSEITLETSIEQESTNTSVKQIGINKENQHEESNEEESNEHKEDHINYIQFEKYLFRKGLYRHPKMVQKYLHHN